MTTRDPADAAAEPGSSPIPEADGDEDKTLIDASLPVAAEEARLSDGVLESKSPPAKKKRKRRSRHAQPGEATARRVVLLGTGSQALRILEILEATAGAWEILGFVSEASHEAGSGPARLPALSDLEKLGGFDALPRLGREHTRLYGVVGFEDPTLRRHHYLRLVRAGIHPARVVHPLASISERAACEPGLVAAAGVVVAAGSVLEQNVMLCANATVQNGARVGAHAFVYPGAVLLHDARVGARASIGPNVVVNPSVSVGEGAVVGSGAVLTRDVPEDSIAYGNPARVVRKREG